MTQEMTGDADGSLSSLDNLGVHFSPILIGNEVTNHLDTLRETLSSNISSTQKLIPYLAGLYTSDQQRKIAERYMFQLQTERQEIINQIDRSMGMIDALHRPVTITYT